MMQFLFLLFFIFLLPSCVTHTPIAPSKSKSSATKIQVTKKHYNPTQNTSIYYPEVSGIGDGEIQEKVNEELKKCFNIDENLQQDTQSYSPDSDEYEVVMHNTGDYDCQICNNVIMIKVYSYLFEEGAVGGYSFISTLCIDGVTGEFYKLKDLLKSEESLMALQTLLQPKFIQERENYIYRTSANNLKI